MLIALTSAYVCIIMGSLQNVQWHTGSHQTMLEPLSKPKT